MRTFAPYDVKKQGSQAGKKKERQERTSNEWDVRIDCDRAYADEIVSNLKNSETIMDYCLVSGIELPDNIEFPHNDKNLVGGSNHYGSQGEHIHIAIVFKYVLRRDQVLSHCRGLLKKTDEYAVPRNRKFTYAGWFLHHTKSDAKLVIEPNIRYEFGMLPRDSLDDNTKLAVQRMYNKFGRGGGLAQESDNCQRFADWL